MTEKILYFQNPRQLSELYCGSMENLAKVETALNVEVVTREGWLRLQGEPGGVEKAELLFTSLQKGREQGMKIRGEDFGQMLKKVAEGRGEELRGLFGEPVVLQFKKRSVVPKTLSQKKYLRAIRNNEMVFGIGPAGTGKTYLAVAAALDALLKEEVGRLILTRPAVEAGEALGFLPGDLQEKIQPYLRPLYDALYDMLGRETCLKYMEREVIEIAPLAYMRGRTLSQAFIILDEAQNTTPEQMLMFLTRLGERSRMIITGDITQVDLPRQKFSGLKETAKVLSSGIAGLEFFYFTAGDVVRHQLVQNIIEAYAKYYGNGGHPRRENPREQATSHEPL